MDSFFFDILGALVGLVTVLLLLSVVVTALVQATQALLRLRGRNLLFGLTGIIAEQTGLSGPEAKEKAREILTANAAPVLRGHIDPLGWLGKWVGPQVSWLEVDDLRRVLDDCALNVSKDVQARIVDRYAKLEKGALSKRFLRNVRLWTIIWALPVAFYFQVSTPAVLNELLSQPHLQPPAPATETGESVTQEELEDALQSLQRLNIEPWRDEWDFYVKDGKTQWSHWVGIFITTILLSFGAPFWFNALLYVVNLRDTLKPPSRDVKKPQTSDADQEAQTHTNRE